MRNIYQKGRNPHILESKKSFVLGEGARKLKKENEEYQNKQGSRDATSLHPGTKS